MTHPLTRNLRVVFSISDILQEVQMPSSTLKLLLCDTTRTIQLPCAKPTTFEFPQVQIGSKIEFDLEDPEGNVYGYSELPVPESVFNSREIQVNQQIHFYLNNVQKEFISAKIFIIFLNAEAMVNSKQHNSLSKLSSKLSMISARSPNTSKSFSASHKKSESISQRQHKPHDKSVHTFVDNLFGQYSQDLVNMSKIQADANNQSCIQNMLSPQASVDNLHQSLVSPVQLFTPKNPISTRDFHSVTSEIANLAETTSRNRLAAITTRSNSTKKFQEDSSRKPSGESSSSLADFRNQISRIYKNRTSQGDKEVKYPVNVEKKPILALNSSIGANEGEQTLKFETFCPNSLNPTNRDKPVENQNQSQNHISAEQLRAKFKEKAILNDKKAGAKKRNSSSSPGIDKQSCLHKSSNHDLSTLKVQIEHLQSTIRAKDSQLSVLETLKKENETLKSTAKKNEANKGAESIEEVKRVHRHLEAQIVELMSDKQGLLDRNEDLINRVEELEKLMVEKMGTSIVTESQNLQLGLQEQEIKNIKEQYEKMQVALQNAEQKLQHERKQFADALMTSQKDLQELKDIITRLTKEKREAKEELYLLQAELNKESVTIQELRDELSISQKNCSLAESYKLVVASLEAEKQDLVRMLFERKKGQSELQNLLESNKAGFAKQVEEHNIKEAQYINQIKELRYELKISEDRAQSEEHRFKEAQYINQIKELRYELKISEDRAGQLNAQLIGMKTKMSDLLNGGDSPLKQIVSVNKEIEKHLEASTHKLAQVVNEKERLSERMLDLWQNQEATSARFVQNDRLVDALRECTNETSVLIEDLKENTTEELGIEALYIPVNEDPVDFALARFINCRDDIQKLKILFTRENKGIYQFGTRRVYIKLEGEKLIARVGGGFVSIAAFLDQYLQPEMEKIARHDSLQNITKQVMPNKAIAGKSAPYIDKKRSSNPHSRDMSPAGPR